MKLLYLHGLGSSGQSSTARALAEAGFELVAPDYQPEHYRQSMAVLTGLVKTHSPDVIIGTSMGGYYAAKLRELYELPTVIVNCCFAPDILLKKYLAAPAWNFTSDEPLEINAEMLAEFAQIDAKKIDADESFRVLIGSNDDVIEAEAQRKFCQQMQWCWADTNWGHRVSDPALLIRFIEAAARAKGA
jgi:predicted esterase YcpF (UPF0227 family)